jgi:hypothetical protein
MLCVDDSHGLYDVEYWSAMEFDDSLWTFRCWLAQEVEVGQVPGAQGALQFQDPVLMRTKAPKFFG